MAVGYYYTAASRIKGISKSYGVLLKALEHEEKRLDVDIVQKILVDLSKNLSEIEGNNMLAINSIHLYFNLDSNSSINLNDIGELIESFAECNAVNSEIETLNKLSDSVNSDKEKVFYFSEILKLIPEYVLKLKLVMSQLEKVNSEFLKLINELKSKFKLY